MKKILELSAQMVIVYILKEAKHHGKVNMDLYFVILVKYLILAYKNVSGDACINVILIFAIIVCINQCHNHKIE
jgi:hypothetical protein